jgi:hypothetical protein
MATFSGLVEYQFAPPAEIRSGRSARLRALAYV